MSSTRTQREDIASPIVRVIPKADAIHGDVRIDDYYWMHDKSNPEVIGYLEAENEYISAMMKHIECP